MQNPLLRIFNNLCHDTAFVVAEILKPTFGYTLGDILPRMGVSANPQSFVEKLGQARWAAGLCHGSPLSL